MGYQQLRLTAGRWAALQKTRVSFDLRLQAFERLGIAEGLADPSRTFIDALEKLEHGYRGELESACNEAPYDGVRDFVDATVGLGPTVYAVLGMVPIITDFANPAKLWKYLGLDVRDGKSPKAKRGEKAGFSLFLRSVALQRIADPIVKNRESPYRAVYDARKTHTLVTHPPMVDAGCDFCEAARAGTKAHRADKAYTRERTALSMDCAACGGPHWTDGHRNRDAMRIVAKAVWRDVWCVGHGKQPKILREVVA